MRVAVMAAGLSTLARTEPHKLFQQAEPMVASLTWQLETILLPTWFSFRAPSAIWRMALNESEFSRARQSLNFYLALLGSAARPAQFGIDKLDRQVSSGIAAAIAGLVLLDSSFQVDRIAGVERTIRASEDIYKRHEMKAPCELSLN